jgi:hypothetical protein
MISTEHNPRALAAIATAAPGTASPAFATGISLAQKRRRCVEILRNPGEYDQALVALCAQVAGLQPRPAQPARRQARN